MSTNALFVPAQDIAPQPMLSLATVRWKIEQVINDENEDVEEIVVCSLFDIVGAKYRLAQVEAAANEIAAENRFLPPRFWLVYDSDNAHDSNAIAAYAISNHKAYHVGFLAKSQAEAYRDSMEKLGRSEQTLEVLGCITYSSAGIPYARICLPLSFSDLILSGYTDTPENNPDWLIDESEVLPRPWQGHNARGFTDSELCRIYCWYARKKGYVCFPEYCENVARDFRSYRGNVPVAMEAFVLDPNDFATWERLSDTKPAREFVRQLLHADAIKQFGHNKAERRMKQVQLGARLHGHEGEVYQVSVHNTEPRMQFAGTVQVRRTGQGDNDFAVEKLIPPPKEEQTLPRRDYKTTAKNFENVLAGDLEKLRDAVDDYEARLKDPPEIIEVLGYQLDKIQQLRDSFLGKLLDYSDFYRSVSEEIKYLDETVESISSTTRKGLANRLIKKIQEWFSAFEMP